MEAASSSPSTCLSLSSDFLTSPSNSVASSSHVGSWPNSCNSSPKRGFAAANSSASCPSSPTKRFHHYDAAASAAAVVVDCTLSLGNALTRSRSSDLTLNEPPNRLSRAGSPIAETTPPPPPPPPVVDHPTKLGIGAPSPPCYQQSPGWAASSDLLLQQQRAFSAEAAARRIAAAAAAAAAARFTGGKELIFARHPVYNSPLPAAGFSPAQELSKFGFLEFNAGGGVGGGGYGSKNNLDPCAARSRFRGVDAHVDPRSVGRICAHCGTSTTPLWRNGPLGPKSLCNACGIRFKKVGRRSPVTVTPVTAAAWNQSGSEQQQQQHQPQQQHFAGIVKRSDPNPNPINDFKPGVIVAAAAAAAAAAPKTTVQVYHHQSIDDKRPCRIENGSSSMIALPFAREWNCGGIMASSSGAAADQSPCSSNAVGSSCITWQDSMPPAVCVDQPSSEDRSKAFPPAATPPVRRPDQQQHTLVLDAEVIRSVGAPVKAVNAVSGHGQSKEEQGRFLRMSL